MSQLVLFNAVATPLVVIRHWCGVSLISKQIEMVLLLQQPLLPTVRGWKCSRRMRLVGVEAKWSVNEAALSHARALADQLALCRYPCWLLEPTLGSLLPGGILTLEEIREDIPEVGLWYIRGRADLLDGTAL